MNIIQLTPGTGSFHCGTCLRDHAMVKAMRARGHDVHMVPLYLPFVTDGDDEGSVDEVFYGGVNVYLQQKSWLFRKAPQWFRKLFNGKGLLSWASKFAGSTDSKQLGEMTCSMLAGEEGKQSLELEHLISWLKTQEKPDVICLSNVLLVGMAKRLKEALGCKIVCFLQGEDAFLDSLGGTWKEKAWQLTTDRCKQVDSFVAVSDYYGALMQERLQLTSNKMHVVHNGIDLTGFEPVKEIIAPPVIGFMARMTPAKGLHTLVDAFIEIRKNDRVSDVKLSVAGALTDNDTQYVQQQKDKLAEAGLLEEADFHPNVTREEKIACLQSLSVLSVPATYGESFGLYILEAWAAGVPVVQPRSGAYPELIEKTNAGVLCAHDDAKALASAIEILLMRPTDAKGMGQIGRDAVEREFNIGVMVERVLAVYDNVISG